MSRYLLLLSLLTTLHTFAQLNDTVFWQQDILLKQQWQHGSSFKTMLGIQAMEKTWKEIKTKHRHTVVEAYWLKQQSFVPNDSLHYQVLAQLFFNVFELEARIFQQQVNNSEEEPEFLETAYMDRANQKCMEIMQNSDSGRKTSVLTDYRLEVNRQLESLPRNNEPVLEPTGFTFSLQLNATGIASSGTFRKYIPQLYGVGAGAELGYRSFLFSVSHSRGIATVADSMVKQDFGFYPGNSLDFRQWWYQLGYNFLDYHRLNFAVYAGINTFRLINKSNPDGSLLSHGPIATNFSASAQLNYTFPPFQHENQGESEFGVFLRVGYNKYNYLFTLPGAGVSVQAGIQLYLRTLTYPKQDDFQ